MFIGLPAHIFTGKYNPFPLAESSSEFIPSQQKKPPRGAAFGFAYSSRWLVQQGHRVAFRGILLRQ